MLSRRTLSEVSTRAVLPSYAREPLTPAIVHIGVGAFHRAHLADYMHELAERGHRDWGIAGAGVMPSDGALASDLTAQDCLYTLATRANDGASARVIGSIQEFVHAHADLQPLVDLIAAPSTQIVSLTITEAGYPVDQARGFDPHSPNAALRSAFAALVRGLRARHDRGTGALTVLSCDNLTSNGGVARTSTLGVVELLDPPLAGWVRDEIAFPNSMVDRITPRTSENDRRWIREEFGIDDRCPVVTEPFRQWVVEDRFATSRPPLEDLDVITTNDVGPYEQLKLRLLNASHSCMAYLASLAGLTTVADVMAEPTFVRYLASFLDDEAGPTVPPVDGIHLDVYKASTLQRFANTAIGDQIDRLCLDGSAKMATFVVPIIRDQLAVGGPIRMAALALAGWCHYLIGGSDSGTPITPAPDPRIHEAQRYAKASLSSPAAFLSYEAVFGADLSRDQRLTSSFNDALGLLRTSGVRTTLNVWEGMTRDHRA